MSQKLRLVSTLVAVALSLSLGACSKNNDDDDDDDDDVNSNPSISSINVTPNFIVAGLGTVTGSATATDPDGDSLTFVWEVSSNNAGPQSSGSTQVTYNGSNFTHLATGGGLQTARVTVSDGRGGSVTEAREFGVANMTGTYRVELPQLCIGESFTFTGTQTGGNFTGTANFPSTFCNVPIGTVGQTDPAVLHTISTSGAIVFRLKVGIFIDMILTGQFAANGRTITGTVQGTAVPNTPFTMTKQ